jgi:hypothetical protein
MNRQEGHGLSDIVHFQGKTKRVFLLQEVRISIHTEKSNKMQQCIKFYYSIFI